MAISGLTSHPSGSQARFVKSVNEAEKNSVLPCCAYKLKVLRDGVGLGHDDYLAHPHLPVPAQRLNQADPRSGFGLNELLGRTCRAISVLALGLRVEPEDAQFLVAATGLGDARRPRDGLVARRQFQHGEAAVERGRPRIAARCSRAVSRDEMGGTSSSMPPAKT